MKLLLQRDPPSPQGTTGSLEIDGAPFCVTLERPVSPFGDPHPCIPAGNYRVALQHSPHFRRVMPHLRDVPGRTGILIHWGNYVADFEGCIGVGDSLSRTFAGLFLAHTRYTFDRLYDRMQAAEKDAIEILVLDALISTIPKGEGN